MRAERNSDSDLDLLMERGREFQTNGAIFLKDRVVATTGSREFDERKAGRYNSLRSDKYLGAEPLRELTVGIATWGFIQWAVSCSGRASNSDGRRSSLPASFQFVSSSFERKRCAAARWRVSRTIWRSAVSCLFDLAAWRMLCSPIFQRFTEKVTRPARHLWMAAAASRRMSVAARPPKRIDRQLSNWPDLSIDNWIMSKRPTATQIRKDVSQRWTSNVDAPTTHWPIRLSWATSSCVTLSQSVNLINSLRGNERVKELAAA